MAYLYHMDMNGTPLEGWEIPEKPLVVGRGDSAEIKLGDGSLSRSHFMIVRQKGQEFLVDLESQNGTSINGERVVGRRLEPGALIQAGKSVFYFCQTRLPLHSPPIELFALHPRPGTGAWTQPPNDFPHLP